MPPEVQLLVILAALVGFWLIVLRPARNAQRRTQELQQAVAVGDDVILTSGIFGTVRSLDGEKVGLELAPGTVITVARQAILRQVNDDATADDNRKAEGESSDEPARGDEE